MKKQVYIETSVISYQTAWPSRDVIQLAKQAATKQWWRDHLPLCDVFVSELVDREIKRGDVDAIRRRQEAVAMLARMEITDEVNELAMRLLQAHALPEVAKDDATHVALATVHEMDILLTWNCKHIANGIMMPKILATIEKSNYEPPLILTPAILLESMGELP